ncbi:MAG: PSD1 domain-containing protein, partial [Planctomycetales bacterium]|nr:PSD1 domain-containing protein [Planctomycetales bacterium]
MCAPVGGQEQGERSADRKIEFVRDVRPIFERHCYQCHGPEKQKSGLRLDVKQAAFAGGDLYDRSIVAGSAKESPLVEFVADADADLQMPPEGPRLSPGEIETLTRWVDQGAEWPDGVDAVKLVDKRDHWSYRPLALVAAPQCRNTTWPRGDIDRFLLARLEQEGLSPAGEADRATWLRRVTFDLHGLPPTPEEVAAFVQDERADAFEHVVERLLASPRYGERWAQHWLDVVRYADTHGFEVNTERPNAWPYRDYVIASLNNRVPYDQFIREQIAGDATGQDAATGFLVTASVLLPGQIGKDAPSMRLARQDSLDEIVVNIGQTFLGMTIGCARCHDHKFDPVSQQDYYAMQALVAGVEYGDRPMTDPQSQEKQQQAAAHKERIAEIDNALARLVPLARVGAPPAQPSSAQKNEERFAPLEAQFVRFAIYDANLHPSLGLIEPCVDEFEIYTDDPDAQNIALASLGTKVVASGSKTSAPHRLEHINDGKYGNSRSWMADQPGRGWVLFELPEKTRIGRIVWSRDREGRYTDRLATAYTITAGPSLDAMQTLVEHGARRASVHPSLNVDRFAPTKAKRVRFTIRATNSLEPCIDELEVFDLDGRNVAAAEAGATATASGETVVADRHELRFVNDGQYGNSRSWMSSAAGEGWVVVEFPQETTIDRVVWARDRKGQFADRLAVDYLIETADANGLWRPVADASDRAAFVAGKARSENVQTAGLSEAETRQAESLRAEKKSLEEKIQALSAQLMVFAGKFRPADDIHRLRRGDPEQPQEAVAPATPSVLGSLKLPPNAPESERRVALAEWIASEKNPLTARVMVNRIWQGHFGRGLVDTPNDFGHNGAPPTHPELLDWLAAEFIESGWSIQHMHRLIVLSAAYRQAATYNRAAAEKDADARLMWRYPARRLDGEAIRDAMLQVSGRLDLTMGGPGFDLFDKRGGLTGFTPVEDFPPGGLRRLIYAHKVRRERD